jgi:hypothetical protein
VAVQPVGLRWVSVLFVDLVGFTSWSEGEDPADVRDLLSGYFEVARSVVAGHGGRVEKFIGDAVMAVWGGDGAHGDDAQRAVRAVRAGLEVVAGVEALGVARGLELVARAGVVTARWPTRCVPSPQRRRHRHELVASAGVVAVHQEKATSCVCDLDGPDGQRLTIAF